MTGVYNVQNEYIDLIETYVEDPNFQRKLKDKRWIWDDLPSQTLGANEYPRISVMHAPSSSKQHELGTTRQRLNARVEIQIRLLKSQKFDSLPAPQFLNQLASDVNDVIRSGTAQTQLLSNASVFQTVLEQENIVYANDMIIKSMVYNNLLVR